MKRITFCMAMLLMAIFGSFGQVQIGDGNYLDKGVPFEPASSYSYTQSIYLSSEVLATGSITSVQWYYAGANTLEGSQELTIYLGHTTKSSFASPSDWETITNLTEVYSGGIQANGAGWISLEFETPFVYDGTNNLVIAVKEVSELTDFGDDDFHAYPTTEDRSITFSSYSDIPDPENPEDGTTLQYVPIVILDGINQACPKPTDLVAADPTTTGISLYWNSSVENPTGGSQYYISLTDTTPLATTEPTGNVPSGEFVIITSGLMQATNYYVWVRDVCNNGPGTWSNKASFTTACDAMNVFDQSFNTTENGAVPVCWTSYVYQPNNAVTGANVVVTDEDGNSGKSVQFYRNGDTDSDLMLVSPMLSNLGAGTHRLKFFAKHSVFNQEGSFEIGTLEGNNPEASLNVVDEISTTNTFTEYTIDFTLIGSTEDIYIGIRLNTTNENFLGYIDDVRWELAPLCPDASDIIIPNVTTTTATIAWTPEGMTEWEVVYSDAATADPSSLTPIPVLENPTALISDLTAETNYFVWVRTKCEAGEGFWVGPISFKTPCNPVNSLNENFDAITTPELPNCWTKILRGNTLSLYASIKTISDGANSNPNAVELYTGFSNPGTNDDIILISPNLGNLSNGTHRLKFFAKGTGNLEIGTLTGNTDDAGFSYFDDVDVSNNEMTEYIIDFSSYGESDTFIGIRYNTNQSFSGVLIDDIVWEVLPVCPDVTEISATALNTSTIAVGWNESGATQWQVAHANTIVTDPNTATISEILTSPGAEISELDSNTAYKVWVRTVCGEPDGNGAWIGPVLVTTSCDVVNVFNETFESAIAPNLPSCWTSMVQNGDFTGAGIGLLTWQPYSGNIGVELFNAGAGPNDNIILISPAVNNLSAGTHRLRFYANHFGLANLEIGTISGDGSFTLFQEVELSNEYEEYIVNFASYTGTDEHIGFRFTSEETYNSIGMDNIVWELDPELSNGDFDNSNFKYYPNPVKDVLNLSYKQDITSISIYNLLGQKVLENAINSNTAQINMSGLANGNYIIKVISENQTRIIKVLKE